MLDNITPLILTFNEASNIKRNIDKLYWAKDIVIVDSGSTDETLNIISEYPNIRIFQRSFTTHSDQWNYALKQTDIKTDWVLALDADYILTDDCIAEISKLNPESKISGYSTGFRYCINGKVLRGGIYPDVTVLYRLGKATYIQDGHTQRINIDGDMEKLVSPINHDDRKTFNQWLKSQQRYMELEIDKLNTCHFLQLSNADRLRKMIFPMPLIMFFYCLIIRGNILDGKEGLYYTMQRTIAEAILSINLFKSFLFTKRNKN